MFGRRWGVHTQWVNKFAALTIMFETELLSQQRLRTTTKKKLHRFLLLLLLIWGWREQKHLIYSMCLCVESWIKKRKNTLYTSSSVVIFTCLNSSEKFLFQTKLLPCSRSDPSSGLSVGLDSLKKEKVLPSAFVSASRQLCVVLCHFFPLSFDCPSFMLNRRWRVFTYPSSSLIPSPVATL